MKQIINKSPLLSSTY